MATLQKQVAGQLPTHSPEGPTMNPRLEAPQGPPHPADHPDLRAVVDLEHARRCLADYRPPDADQQQLRDRVLQWTERYPEDAHRRERLEGHLTASALVVSADLERVLLLHHRKLGRWLQPGGHCDGDANLAGVALRESIEETGIPDLRVDPRVVDVDIHSIPARGDVPEHLHLDTRFRVYAPAGAEPVRNHESNDLRWFTVDEALAIGEDPSVDRLLHRSLVR
ncbi:MAG: NUDIX hydrolase [Acidobacteriota bacterium]